MSVLAIPYTSPWNDLAHKLKAEKGLCFRLVCPNIADHGWRNMGVPGARYCRSCVKLLNAENPGICVEEGA
jgi:hypothetical protein